MLRSAREMTGYDLKAIDDTIGKVSDFLFDDWSWVVRYLIADTGGWLTGRLVLISPVVLGQPHWGSRLFPVDLTKEQIEKSPNIETGRPVDRQLEAEIANYYEWPDYIREIEAATEGRLESDLPHLRSVKEVTGYDIQALDGGIGHVEDFILDDEDWTVRYIVVDTRKWLPGRKVLVSPSWTVADAVDWAGSRVKVDLTKEAVKNSPEYDPSAPVNREYELRLYDYYGRPKYWL